jgi:hypothetical protein
MSKSLRNVNKDKCRMSSRDTLVDWGSLLNLITAELDACATELKGRKRRMVEVEARYFASNKPFEQPTTDGLKDLASALGRLDHGIDSVVSRLGQIRAKAFQDLASDAIRDLNDYLDLE